MTILLAGQYRLRPWAREDIEALPDLANDFEVVRYMSRRFPHPYTRAHAESWISVVSEERTALKFAIEVDGELAGGIGFDLLKHEGTGTAETGYWLGRRFWGRGIATVRLGSLVEYGFTALRLRRLQAHVMVPNYASARVLEHNGFICEGTLRRFTVDRDDVARDNLMYALLNTTKSVRNTKSDVQFELREPSAELAASYEAMRDAVLRTGYNAWTGPGDSIALTDVEAYIKAVAGWAKGQGLPEGWVASSTYWIVQDGEVVGDVNIRHRLTEHLRNIGGHIGYLTHSDHRNKGVATFALREGLKILTAMGVQEAIVTCLDDNMPSIRVIEKCHGRRIEDSSKGPKRRRYLFTLAKTGATGFQVRFADDHDIDSIVALHEMVAAEDRWLATEAPIDKERHTARFRTALQNDDAAMFVAVSDGKVIGELGLLPHWPGPGLYGLGMFLEASWRGKGVGWRLVEAAIAWARSKGGYKIVLDVFPDNMAAIALYTKAGFVREGYHPKHLRRRSGELRDLISMGLSLRD